MTVRQGQEVAKNLSAAPPRRRRILLVIAGLPAGGAERQMALLARGLDRSRFEPGLLIFNRAEKIHYRDILDTELWFRALGLSGGSRLKLAPRLIAGTNRAVRDFNPDIVHSSLNVANHAVRIAALLGGWKKPIISSVRNNFVNGYRPSERILERFLCKRSAAITCNSREVRNQLLAGLGLPSTRISLIPNGIDDRFFDADAGAPPDWWPGGPAALCVGRFTRQKNHLALIEAFASAARQELFGDWSLVFVGEGPLEARMRLAIDAAGLAGRIHIHPPVRDIAALYQASRLVIAPSLFEGMSNVCIEAAASGTPVVVTPAAAPGTLLEAGGGWMLGETPGEMSRTLVDALRKSPDELRMAGELAKLYARENHSVAGMVRETMTLYDKLGMTG